MSYHYYRTRIDFGQIVKGKPLATCNLGESISQQLMMLITTRKGEMPGDPEFGSDIWELQFDRIVDQRRWEEAVGESLKAGIRRYENRLKNIEIEITLEQVEVAYPFRQYPDIKRQAKIQVTGELKHSGEKFRFGTDVYTSPLSK